MQLRRATMEDMYDVQQCNLRCLPENYNLRLYYYHILSWPQLLYVQSDYNRRTVGYVLGKVDDEEDASKAHGHITSLAVLRSHRKLGIASRVMRATLREMEDEYKVPYCSLHVRKTNDAALHLYQDTLGFRCASVDAGYYLDGEDAFLMKKQFSGDGVGGGMYVNEHRQLVHKPLHTTDGKTTVANAAAAAVSSGDADGSGGSGKKVSAKAGGNARQTADGGGGGGKKAATTMTAAAASGAGGRASDTQTALAREHAMAELLEELGEGKGKGKGGNRTSGAQGKKGKK